MKGGKKMTTIQHFMTKICIFLSFSVSASKLGQLLITAYAAFTNPIQTNYDSNVAIWTFDHEPSTNFLKPFPAPFPCECSGGGVLSLRAADTDHEPPALTHKLFQTFLVFTPLASLAGKGAGGKGLRVSLPHKPNPKGIFV
jgi:hypothetical protein